LIFDKNWSRQKAALFSQELQMEHLTQGSEKQFYFGLQNQDWMI
jgi:hypothetical protein